MINFLIKIKQDGELLDIVWSEPAYLFLSSSDNLFHQIDFAQWPQLEQDILGTIGTSHAFNAKTKYNLKSTQASVYIDMIHINHQVLVLGHEVDEPVCRHAPSHQKIVSRFLETMAKVDDQQKQFNEGSRTNYFEKIQALNNDLINTQRELLKANAKLNHLNGVLNNRLVKDPLTGLISRYQYEDEIALSIQQAPKKYGVFAFIDLDDFKKVNDTYGHQVGDVYLKTFAQRLSFIDVQNLLKIRIAGDEFGLYAHGFSLEECDKIIDQIKSDIEIYVKKDCVEVESHQLPIQLCIGFAIYNHHSNNVYQLIDYADHAMYQAKKSGKGKSHIFDLQEYNDFKLNEPHE